MLSEIRQSQKDKCLDSTSTYYRIGKFIEAEITIVLMVIAKVYGDGWGVII